MKKRKEFLPEETEAEMSVARTYGLADGRFIRLRPGSKVVLGQPTPQAGGRTTYSAEFVIPAAGDRPAETVVLQVREADIKVG